MSIVSRINERGAICDWQQCTRVADFHVRTDLPRGDSFTSLMWVRCGDHIPREHSACY